MSSYINGPYWDKSAARSAQAHLCSAHGPGPWARQWIHALALESAPDPVDLHNLLIMGDTLFSFIEHSLVW